MISMSKKLVVMLTLMLVSVIIMPSQAKAVTINFSDGTETKVKAGTKILTSADNTDIQSGSITISYPVAEKPEVTLDNCTIEGTAGSNYYEEAFKIIETLEYIGGEFIDETITDFKVNLIGNNTINYDVSGASESAYRVEAFGIYVYNVPLKITGGGTLTININGNTNADNIVGYSNMSKLEIENATLNINMNGLKGEGFKMCPGDASANINNSELYLLDGGKLNVTSATSGSATLFSMPAHQAGMNSPAFIIDNGASLILDTNTSTSAKAYVNDSITPTLRSNIKAKGGDAKTSVLKYDITHLKEYQLLSDKKYIEFSETDATRYEEIVTSNINIATTENGTVNADKSSADTNNTITLTIEPNDGYKIKSTKIYKVSDSSDVTSSVNYSTTNKTFKMPSYDVEVEVKFEKIDYTLTGTSSEGTVTFENGITTAQIGDKFDVIFTPIEPTDILSTVKVKRTDNSQDVTSEVYNAETKEITMKNFPITVIAEFTRKVYSYKVLSGDNTKVDTKNMKDIEIRIDGDYKNFVNVYINNVELDKSNYNSKEGSTIITLKKSYLSTLKPGIYKMKVAFGKSTGITKNVETTFIITDNENTVKNPQTSDTGIMYAVLLALSTIISGVLMLKKEDSSSENN